MKKTIAFAAGIIFAAAPFFAQNSYSESDLVWKDDFDGNSLNLDDWNYEYHEPGWVNNELQEYVDSKENIYVKDGNLPIRNAMIAAAATDVPKYLSHLLREASFFAVGPTFWAVTMPNLT